MTLPVIRDRLAVSVDRDCRVVVFWGRRPLQLHVNLLRIADSDDAVVFQSNRPSP